MDPATAEDLPVCILELNMDSSSSTKQMSSMKFHEEKTQSILAQAEDLPFAILSIAGEARQGKSYFLSCLIKYLQCLEADTTPTIELSSNEEFFHFENGTDRVTAGVWMWPHAFKLFNEERMPFVLFLMDTQGLFDKWTGPREWNGLAGFSLLTSSCLIYNTINSLKENILQLFATFCESTKLQVPGLDENLDETLDKPFQKLIFLIRDWGFPDAYDYGTETGQSYISRRLSADPHKSDSPSKHALHARKSVNESFQKINCGLLPPPGNAAKQKDFQGSLHQLDRKFSSKLRQFIQDLVILDGIPIKTRTCSSKQQMSQEEFIALIQSFAKAYNNSEIINATNIAEINVQSSNLAAVQISTNHYRSEMSKISLENIYSLQELLDLHTQSEEDAISKFQAFQKFGSDEQQVKFEANLKSKIKAAFSIMKRNYEKGESSKFSESIIKAKKQFTTKLETIMESINLERAKKSIIELEGNSIQSFNSTMQSFNVTLNSEHCQQFVEFIRAKGQEAQEKCNNIGKQAEACLQNAQFDFQIKLDAKFTNFMQSRSDQVPKVVLEQIGMSCKNGAVKVMLPSLRELKISEDSIGIVMERFETQTTQKLENIRINLEEGNSKMQKMIDSMVLTYEQEMQHILTNKFFTDEYKINFDLQNHLTRWHYQEREKKLNILEQSCTSSNAMAKLRQNLTSKLDSNLFDYTSKIDKIQSQIADYLNLHNRTFATDVKKKLDSIDTNSMINPSTKINTAALIQNNSDKLKFDLDQEIKNFPILRDSQIDILIAQVQKEWSTSAENMIQEKLKILNNQEQQCVSAMDDVARLYFEKIQIYLTLEEFQNHDDAEINKAMAYFAKFSNNLSQPDKTKADERLRILLGSKRTEIIQKLTTSSNAEAQRLQKIVEKQVNDFAIDVDRQFPTRNRSNKILLYSESDIANFCGTEIRKSKMALYSYGKDCPDSIISGLQLQMEKEFESMQSEKIIINTNNTRAFEEVLQASINQVIRSIIQQPTQQASNATSHANRFPIEKHHDKIIHETTNLINLSPFAFDLDVLRPKILESLTRHKHFNNKLNVSNFDLTNTPQHSATLVNFAALCTPSHSGSIPPPQTKTETEQPTMEKEIENIVLEFDQILGRHNSDSQDLNSLHMKQQEFSDAFVTKFKSTGIRIEPWQEKLKKALARSLDEYVEAIRKAERQRIIDEDEAKNAFEFYKNEFNKQRSNCEAVQFLTPGDLNKFHNKSRHLTNTRFPDLSKEHRAQLESLVEDYFQKLCLDQAENASLDPAIGIDLGTTFSCVAIFWEGQMTVIPNLGKRTTPSYVAFKLDGTLLVGEEAKSQAFIDPGNTIFDGKRLIGRPFEDKNVQDDIKNWPFKVVKELGKPKIEVHGKTYHPEQIAAKILSNLKKAAEKFLGRKVTNAVVTVPAYFNDGQRQATRDAGAMADLNVIRIINEPTAAAFAYNLDRGDLHVTRNILIYDFGGGTFDISILNMTRNQIRTLVVNGDSHLGGEDFDSSIVAYCVEQFEAQHGVDLMEGRENSDDRVLQAKVQRRMRRLRHVSEQAKIELSQATLTHLSLARIYEELDLELDLTRLEFEKMNEHLFVKSIQLVDKSLEEANLHRDQIDEIVLVGGSTRIPRIQELLVTYFEKPLNSTVSPDEAVARGAALQAAILTGNLEVQMKSKKLNLTQGQRALVEMRVSDVTPYAMGVELLDGTMSIIIPKNSPVPTSETQTYLTAYDNQTSVLIVIYEGESTTVVANHKVGEFYLNGIPPALAGEQRIDVTLSIDKEGITHVTAICRMNETQQELTVREHKGRISAAEKRELIEIVDD